MRSSTKLSLKMERGKMFLKVKEEESKEASPYDQ